MKDFTIIGAGYAGVAAGALLVKNGFSVEIIESHNLIGGCASYFRKKNFLFDVGATTLSGVLPHQPLGKLFAELDLKPDIKKLDIGISVFLEGEWVRRYADWDLWISEAERVFPESSTLQRKFWTIIRSIEKDAWDFIGRNTRLPPRTISDFLSLSKPSNWKYITLLPKIFFSLRSLLNDLSIKDKKFEKFLEEQLLITTQSGIDEAPILTAAMGLAYPSETYYPIGGITSPLELVLNKFKDLGGNITFKEKIKEINYSKNNIICRTVKGKEFHSKYLVSTIPIWNMKQLTGGVVQKYFNSYSNMFPEGPGAFVINFGFKSEKPITGGYYQIHTHSKIPHCEAGAFFMTISEPGDLKRAPEGYQTITISTHTDATAWQDLRGEDYIHRKREISTFILSNLEVALPEFRDVEKLFFLEGSPRTFERYTGRENGFVGGIPHRINRPLLLMPPNRTKFYGLFQGGDTAFPGQGTPAVVQGAFQILEYSKSL